MTQSNDRLDRVEAILTQLAEQAAADRQASNERMTRIEQQTAENSQAIQATSRDVAQLVTSQRVAIDDVISMIGTLAQTQEAQGRRIDQAIAELQAANQRQERINDFLLRERGLNGG
jgi:hypothetical protein